MWLLGFVPMQQLCARVFENRGSEDFSRFFAALIDHGPLFSYGTRRYERASTLLTSNRPVDDWDKLLGDTAAVTALLGRLLHHAHVLKCGPRS